MINGMYLSTMGALSQATRHATIANNLANANTTGFKPDVTRFRSLPAESKLQPGHRFTIDEILERTGGGVWLEQTATEFEQGPLRFTGNPLDVALGDAGDGQVGFFMVRPRGGADEEVRYTRDGHFVINNEGLLSTVGGDLVLDAGGAPISLAGLGPVSIRDDGWIVEEGTNVLAGQIGVVRTGDPNKLKKIGDNQYLKADAQLVNSQAGVKSKNLEASATNTIKEMAAMIEGHRTYQANMTFLRMQDESLGETVTRLGRIA